MIRQLWRLTYAINLEGVSMCAPAVYAERKGRAWVLERADESGYEGVACVDDAARLAVLLLRAYKRFRLPWARDWAQGLIKFVKFMQEEDGSFANFILDWDGKKNYYGPTSYPGGQPWLARGLWALAWHYIVFKDMDSLERLRRGVGLYLKQSHKFMDVNALVAYTLLELYEHAHDRDFLDIALSVCEEIASHKRDGLLLISDEDTLPHLWGYIQPGVLFKACQYTNNTDWEDLATYSLHSYLAPIVRSEFDKPTTLPYEVSSTAFNFRIAYEYTANEEFRTLYEKAKSWFYGDNPAKSPVYDRNLGVVYDGIDNKSVSKNSGAESNIEGAMALFDDLPWHQYKLGEVE